MNTRIELVNTAQPFLAYLEDWYAGMVDLPLSEHAERVYVHLDLDVLDASVATANTYAVSGGLTLDDMRYALSTIAGKLEIRGVTLSAFDPTADNGRSAERAAVDLICTTASFAGRT